MAAKIVLSFSQNDFYFVKFKRSQALTETPQLKIPLSYLRLVHHIFHQTSTGESDALILL